MSQGPEVPIVGQKQRPKVMIGIPYYKDISVRTMSGVINLLGRFPAQWTNMWHGTANVVQGRNVIAEAFVASDCDYLFFVDADMAFDPMQFVELFQALERHPDAGLIGGMYLKRDGSMTPLVGILDENGYPPRVDDHLEWLIKNRGNVVDADLLPTGFMIIHRRAFEGRQRPYFYRDWPWKDLHEQSEDQRAKMWSSDNVFVRDTRKMGLRTLAHLGVEVGHIGEVVYIPQMFYEQAHTYTVAAQIARLKAQAGAELGFDSPEYWNHVYKWEEEAGYSRDDKYQTLHEGVLAAILPGQKVLDMGSGPGVLAAKIRAAGNDVTCMDFSAEAIHQAAQKGLPGQVFDLEKDSVERQDHGKYDVVVATEILEHLTDPEKAVKKLYSFLKPGGLMIVSVPDTCLPPEEEPEHKHLVTEAGLRTWLSALSDITVIKIDAHFPKLLGLGIKPEKS